MATEFLAEAPNPQGLFIQIQQWASANGFQLNGGPKSGNFRGTPGGIEGMFMGEIIGNYTVSGNQITIRVNKNIPADAVAQRLARFGLRLIGAR